MKNNLKIAGASLLAAAAMMSSSASAQTTTFDFRHCTNASCTTTTNSPLVGAAGNSLTFWNNNNTISVKVTAWSVATKTATPQLAYLGWYDKGLGVTSDISGNAQNGYTTGDNSHTIDNIGKFDFVTLEFSTYVQVKNATLAAFDVDGNGADNDPSISFTSGPAGSFLSATQQADLILHTTELSGQTAAFNINPGGNSGNIWTIGADRLLTMFPQRDDGFKLTSLTVAIPTPEPASWAMMIGGFGVTGASLRRRRSRTGKPALA